MTKNTDAKLTIRISNELREQLEQEARHIGSTVSQLTRKILETYFEEKQDQDTIKEMQVKISELEQAVKVLMANKDQQIRTQAD